MQFIFLNLFIDMKIEIVHSANHHQLGGAKNNNLHAPRTGHRHQQKKGAAPFLIRFCLL